MAIGYWLLQDPGVAGGIVAGTPPLVHSDLG
jgi:hypothetical protein